MFNPAHPGEVYRLEVLPRFGQSVASAARALNANRQNLHKLLQGQVALTPEMALKFEKAFGVDAGLMMNVQTNWDLAQARRRQEEITAGVERQTVKAAA